MREEYEITRVMEAYGETVYRLAVSLLRNQADAEDVFQEVFLQFANESKPFESEAHIKAWLLRVTINRCKTLRTSAWFRHTALSCEYPEHTGEWEEGDDQGVFAAVMKLPVKYRRVVHLFYYEDMPVAKIAEILNLRESSVTSQLCRARKLLKTKLEGSFDYE